MTKHKLIAKKNNIPKLMKRIQALTNKTTEVGYFSSQPSHSESGIGYAQMAAWLEYGTKKTRAYPLFHRTVEFFEHPSKSNIIKSSLKGYFNNLDSSKQYNVVLSSIGKGYAEIIQAGMGKPHRTGNSNTPSTVAAKGNNSPWIDTGELKQNISYRFNGTLFTLN